MATLLEIKKETQRDFMKAMQFNSIYFPKEHDKANKIVKETVYKPFLRNWEECQKFYVDEFSKLIDDDKYKKVKLALGE
jgi:hypothetical protein